MESLNLPVPACFEMTERDGRFGIVYEKVPETDLYTFMVKTGEFQKGLEILASFQKQIWNRILM